MTKNKKETHNVDYIGDGVYVDFDGYSIWLKANNYENPTDTIALDPEVFNALIRYANQFNIGFNHE